jgi:hypothetical protein
MCCTDGTCLNRRAVQPKSPRPIAVHALSPGWVGHTPDHHRCRAPGVLHPIVQDHSRSGMKTTRLGYPSGGLRQLRTNPQPIGWQLSDDNLESAIDLRNHVGSAAWSGHEAWRKIYLCIIPRILRKSRTDTAKDAYDAKEVWYFLYFIEYDGSTRGAETIRQSTPGPSLRSTCKHSQ